MDPKTTRFHRSRKTDDTSVYFYFSPRGYWILSCKGPDEPPTDHSIPVHNADLRPFAEALIKFRASGDNQKFTRDFGEFDQRLTVITAEKILNKNGLGIRMDEDDRAWLLEVISGILQAEPASK